MQNEKATLKANLKNPFLLTNKSWCNKCQPCRIYFFIHFYCENVKCDFQNSHKDYQAIPDVTYTIQWRDGGENSF